jgi:hypothetical protein
VQQEAIKSAQAISELQMLLMRGPKAVLSASRVRIERDSYRTAMARLSETAEPFLSRERERSETAMSELVAELERVGNRGHGSRVHVDRSDVLELVTGLERRISEETLRWLDDKTSRIDLDAPGRPTLATLVERVQRDDERFLICEHGAVLADLRAVAES